MQEPAMPGFLHCGEPAGMWQVGEPADTWQNPIFALISSPYKI